MTNRRCDLSNKICQKIRLERLKRKLTQEQLAEKADLSRPSIGKIERAEVSPTIDTIERIAKVFGMSFLDLVDVTKFDL